MDHIEILERNGNIIDATIGTDHAASSYGMPVVVIGGEPHGPADLWPFAIVRTAMDRNSTWRDHAERDRVNALVRRAGLRCQDDIGGGLPQADREIARQRDVMRAQAEQVADLAGGAS